MNVAELVRNILTTANMATMRMSELAYDKVRVFEIYIGLCFM
jgi:hypothetical protein